MASDKKSTPSTNKNVSISGDVVDSVVIAGDNNTVNQTIIQKFFNIFKSDSETLEQRNRRILLGHVENAWIKGVLDASLHGAALLDLGIKQDPDAVKIYPWAIKKESTDETLPAGTSMLEIFDSIGMGRSLLILGAPGSGKTTMLLELARGLIASAREDVTQPIPMVFNLASWTEKLTLADWLAQELNNLYSVPRKTAPDWVKGDKLFLLLDGLDEVRQDNRAKCVEAINAFRKEHGLTSLAVCSRSQDYADLNAKLSFEGAIEVQPLTQEQITEFFNRFGKEMAGIKQVLKKDTALREMAETPLFLSIMIMAYRGKQDVEILTSGDEKARHKRLFGTYIERMLDRPRLMSVAFKEQDLLRWLSWLAQKMIEHNAFPYQIENIQPIWLGLKNRWNYRLGVGLICGLFYGLIGGLNGGFFMGLLLGSIFGGEGNYDGWLGGSLFGLLSGLIVGESVGIIFGIDEIKMFDKIVWDKKKGIHALSIGLIVTVIMMLVLLPILVYLIVTGALGELFTWIFLEMPFLFCITGFIFFGMAIGILEGLKAKPNVDPAMYSGQRIYFLIRNSFLVYFLLNLIAVMIFIMISILASVGGGEKLFAFLRDGALIGMLVGLVLGSIFSLRYGGLAVAQHYTIRFFFIINNFLPWRLVPFLDHCVDLIFLRRVGGGYIFVHRLLMEHFAEMYVETPTSKGN